MKTVITLITLLIVTNLSAQFDTTYTFYKPTLNKVDLHYDLNWTRSDSTVTLSNNKMTIPKDQWFQTGPTKLTGSGYISNDYKVTNSSGTSKLKIEFINVKTNAVTTKLDTTVTNATTKNFILYLSNTDTSTYYIRYTYTNIKSNSTCKLEMTTFDIIDYVALPLVEIKHRKDTIQVKLPSNYNLKIYRSSDMVKLIIDESNEYEYTIYSIDGKVICKETGVSNGIVNIPYESNQINIIVINTLGKVTSHKL